MFDGVVGFESDDIGARFLVGVLLVFGFQYSLLVGLIETVGACLAQD